MTGEMSEGYVRDENDLHPSEMPLYKGNSCDDGRDEGFFQIDNINQGTPLCIYSHFARFVQFYIDFCSESYYFQYFFVYLYTICLMLGKNN